MVKLFINDNIVDLFKDEEIKIVSKSSDIESLGKVFNDFSMPFSIPATPKNNELFKHYYNPNVQNGLNVNKRFPSYIEYDSFPFKFGKVQLEGVKMKDGQPYSYNLTFYGGATQLKETFDEHTIDKLDMDLEGNKVYDTFSSLNFQYNLSNWRDSLWNDTFKNGELITPPIAVVDRPLQLGSNNKNDLLGDLGALRASETRPAVRLPRIIDGIETKFDISFSDHIFNSAHFNNLYLWLNRREELEFPVSLIKVGSFSGPDPDNRFEFDSEGYFNYERNVYSDNTAQGRPTDYRLFVYYNISPTALNDNIKYKVRITNEDGRIIRESEDWEYGSSYFTHRWQSRNPDPGDDINATKIERWKLEIIAASGVRMDVTAELRYEEYVYNFDISEWDWQPVYGNYIVGNASNYLLTEDIIIESNVPEIKVIDLVSNIMKMYKAVIIPTSNKDFEVIPIDLFYRDGDVFDITKFVDTKNKSIQIPEIYNKIVFKYKKTKNFFGVNFRERNDPLNDEIGYGDLGAEFDIDTKKGLDVELIFNNMLFNRMVYNSKMTDPRAGEPSSVIIGQSTTMDGSEFKKNKSDPIIFYRNGVNVFNIGESIKVGFIDIDPDGTGSGPTSDISGTHLIGNTDNWKINQITNTINWGAEIDPYHEVEVDKSLYNNYWKNWIENIYDPRQRRIKVNANLPLSILSKIKLNSKLIINDNIYLINEMTMNLTTGRTELTLFNQLFPTSKPPLIDRYDIDANCGMQYYGVRINADKGVNWSSSLIADGYGTDWVELIRSSGTGQGEVLIKLKSMLELPVFEWVNDRRMKLEVVIGGATYTIPIFQRAFTQ